MADVLIANCVQYQIISIICLFQWPVSPETITLELGRVIDTGPHGMSASHWLNGLCPSDFMFLPEGMHNTPVSKNHGLYIGQCL